ncbi:unnamed protein product [Cyprideis torosa]|uniref:Phospholysine phosphohistidine inorganic pyrophosphate phosphatase n=1 Tax=Cyprideis torosa TaxID=163714 RepID=A0A7R8ZJI4_9CRUS|nr:unnamed protein product [Cyprideis torosa]CAG0888725.1 unnamed protein product [Cyprideis torosa]
MCTSGIRGVLLDVVGVLYESVSGGGGSVIDGSVAAVSKLREAGIPVRFVSNETQATRKEMFEKLKVLGFDVNLEEIFMPAPALRKQLVRENLRPFLLVHPNIVPEFSGLATDDFNCVVLGDATDGFSYENMNKTFRSLMKLETPRLFSLGKGRYYRENGELTLDVGPFVAALEFATGIEAEVVGKPNRQFFLDGVADLAIECCSKKQSEFLEPKNVVMIGDDIVSDIGGAQKAGLQGYLVRTGKYQPKDEKHPSVTPHAIVDNLLAGIENVLKNRAFLDRFGDSIALVDPEGSRLSYSLLSSLTQSLSSEITSRLLPDSPSRFPPRVCLLCPHDSSFPLALLAIWWSGSVAVPLSPLFPPSQLEYYLRDSQAGLVITTKALSSQIEAVAKGLKIPLFRLPSQLQQIEERFAKDEPVSVSPTDKNGPALILYTSGTTGPPKGALHSHATLQGSLDALTSAWKRSQEDVVLHTLPLDHMHGLANVLLNSLYVGGRCVMHSKFDPAQVWRSLLGQDEQGVNLYMAVPTIYKKLIDHYETDGLGKEEADVREKLKNNIRLFISGSSALPVPIFGRWEEISGHRILERYGMTEIGMGLSNPVDGPRVPGTVGTPLPGMSFQIAHVSPGDGSYETIAEGSSEEGIFVGVGREGEGGELIVRGPSVFLEYWRKPSVTKKEFLRDGWFRTGDTATVTKEDRYVKILGRTSVDMIKSGGYRLSALEVESHLLEHPQVAEAVVFGLPDPTWGQKVVAMVKQVEGQKEELTLTLVKDWLRDRLPSYSLPSVLLLVDKIPRNALGKVNKKELMTKWCLASEVVMMEWFHRGIATMGDKGFPPSSVTVAVDPLAAEISSVEASLDVFSNHWTQARDIIRNTWVSQENWRSHLDKKWALEEFMRLKELLEEDAVGTGRITWNPRSCSPDEFLCVSQHLKQMNSLLSMEIASRRSEPLSAVAGRQQREALLRPGPLVEALMTGDILPTLLEWANQNEERFGLNVHLGLLQLYESLLREPRLRLWGHGTLLKPLLGLVTACGSSRFASLEAEERLVSLLNLLCSGLTQDMEWLDHFFSPAAPHSESQDPSRFIVLSLLIPFVHRDGRIGQEARDALLLCLACSRGNEIVAAFLADHSSLCLVLPTGLTGLFSTLPRRIPSRSSPEKESDLHDLNIMLHLSAQSAAEIPELSPFLTSLEFTNAVFGVAHSRVQQGLIQFLRQGFLDPALGPALYQADPEEQATAVAYLDLIIRTISDPLFLQAVLNFLFTSPLPSQGREWSAWDNPPKTLIQGLVPRIISPHLHVTATALNLFRTLIDLCCEDVLLDLVLQFLIPGHHVMSSQRHRIADDINPRASALAFLELVPTVCLGARDPPASTPKEETAFLTRTTGFGGRRLFHTTSESPRSMPTEDRSHLHPKFRFPEKLSLAHAQIQRFIGGIRSWRFTYSVHDPFPEELPELLGPASGSPLFDVDWWKKGPAELESRRRGRSRRTRRKERMKRRESRDLLSTVSSASPYLLPQDPALGEGSHSGLSWSESLEKTLKEIEQAALSLERSNHEPSTPKGDGANNGCSVDSGVPSSVADVFDRFMDPEDSDDALRRTDESSVEEEDNESDLLADIHQAICQEFSDSDDPMNRTPDLGPLLTTLLLRLETLSLAPLPVSVLTCTLVTSLAALPVPLLRAFLLSPALLFQPSIKSLKQILASLKYWVEQQLVPLPSVDVEALLTVAREEVRGTSQFVLTSTRPDVTAMTAGLNGLSETGDRKHASHGGSWTSGPRSLTNRLFGRGKSERSSSKRSVVEELPSRLGYVFTKGSLTSSTSVHSSLVNGSSLGGASSNWGFLDPVKQAARLAIILEEWAHDLAALAMEQAATQEDLDFSYPR